MRLMMGHDFVRDLLSNVFCPNSVFLMGEQAREERYVEEGDSSEIEYVWFRYNG